MQIWNVETNTREQVVPSTGQVKGLDWHPTKNITCKPISAAMELGTIRLIEAGFILSLVIFLKLKENY